jgi:hypothetical protein
LKEKLACGTLMPMQKIALFKGSNLILKFQQVKRSLKLRSHKSLLDGEEYGRVSLRY